MSHYVPCPIMYRPTLIKQNTWTLAVLPPWKKALPLSWVCQVKRDSSNNFERYKASISKKPLRRSYELTLYTHYLLYSPGKDCISSKPTLRMHSCTAQRFWNLCPAIRRLCRCQLSQRCSSCQQNTLRSQISAQTMYSHQILACTFELRPFSPYLAMLSSMNSHIISKPSIKVKLKVSSASKWSEIIRSTQYPLINLATSIDYLQSSIWRMSNRHRHKAQNGYTRWQALQYRIVSSANSRCIQTVKIQCQSNYVERCKGSVELSDFTSKASQQDWRFISTWQLFDAMQTLP